MPGRRELQPKSPPLSIQPAIQLDTGSPGYGIALPVHRSRRTSANVPGSEPAAPGQPRRMFTPLRRAGKVPQGRAAPRGPTPMRADRRRSNGSGRSARRRGGVAGASTGYLRALEAMQDFRACPKLTGEVPSRPPSRAALPIRHRGKRRIWVSEQLRAGSPCRLRSPGAATRKLRCSAISQRLRVHWRAPCGHSARGPGGQNGISSSIFLSKTGLLPCL
jgi:hypothetical protein